MKHLFLEGTPLSLLVQDPSSQKGIDFFFLIPALLDFDRDLSPAVMFINFLKAMLRVTIVFSNFSNL